MRAEARLPVDRLIRSTNIEGPSLTATAGGGAPVLVSASIATQSLLGGLDSRVPAL